MKGNTATVCTGQAGNGTEGGNGCQIVDEGAAPQISGCLAVGERLGGALFLRAADRKPDGRVPGAVGQAGDHRGHRGHGNRPGHPAGLHAPGADAGSVMEVSMLAKNG